VPEPEEPRLAEAFRFETSEAEAGERLDAFLATRLGLGRRAASRLAERARINGRRARKGQRLAGGDRVEIEPATEVSADESALAPHVLLEEELLVVLDKPPGLPTVAVRGRDGPSVAAWLTRRLPECAGVGGPGESGIVHRLDTWTSGVLLVARAPAAYQSLRGQFRRHHVEKRYLALVAGDLAEPVVIDAAIGQHQKSRTRVRALPAGEHARYEATPAETTVAPVRRFGSLTLVEARTDTGARHQIRVHLAFAGHPLVADERYGGAPLEGVPHHLLHAAEVSWRDLRSDERRTIRVEPPSSWQEILARLGHEQRRRDRAR